MREIKFRSWNARDKLMSDPFDIFRGTQIWRSKHESAITYASVFPDYEIMQFTGLKDKNGKEIYEGDIVRFLNGETTSTESGMECDEFLTDGVIYWEYESAQWNITGRIDVSREDAFTDLSEYEVVGNRFENPDLINLTR